MVTAVRPKPNSTAGKLLPISLSPSPRLYVFPYPSCPVLLRPQHFTDPSSSRSEEHTSELQSLMRISYAVFCLKNKNTKFTTQPTTVHKNNNNEQTNNHY